MIIETRAFARAGLLGNPSDGFFGKTISIIVRNFGASVLLYESPELRIEEDEEYAFRNLRHFTDTISKTGYYGGKRLVKAAIKKFCDYCDEQGIKLPYRNFTVRFSTTIPRQVGLSGSSAIITATFKALMQFFEVQIPMELPVCKTALSKPTKVACSWISTKIFCKPINEVVTNKSIRLCCPISTSLTKPN